MVHDPSAGHDPQVKNHCSTWFMDNVSKWDKLNKPARNLLYKLLWPIATDFVFIHNTCQAWVYFAWVFHHLNSPYPDSMTWVTGFHFGYIMKMFRLTHVKDLAKRKYYEEQFAENSRNSKRTWKLIMIFLAKPNHQVFLKD